MRFTGSPRTPHSDTVTGKYNSHILPFPRHVGPLSTTPGSCMSHLQGCVASSGSGQWEQRWSLCVCVRVRVRACVRALGTVGRDKKHHQKQEGDRSPKEKRPTQEQGNEARSKLSQNILRLGRQQQGSLVVGSVWLGFLDTSTCFITSCQRPSCQALRPSTAQPCTLIAQMRRPRPRNGSKLPHREKGQRLRAQAPPPPHSRGLWGT